MAEQVEIKGVLYNAHPTDSHYENGQWIPDPVNCPLHYADRSAHDLGRREHITSISGYCTHGVLGGCPKDAA